MDESKPDHHLQQFLANVESMDEDEQAAFVQFMEMINTLPKGAPFPSTTESMEFLERARAENIRKRLGGVVGQLVAFPTDGLRTDVKAYGADYPVIVGAIERAIESAQKRSAHIRVDLERAHAESRAAAEEAGAEYLSLVAKWLAVTAPDVHRAFLAEFGPK